MSLLLSQVLLFGILILFLMVGLSYKKGPQTMREYALGSKKLNTSVLIYTMIATVFGGGSIIGASAALYQHGAWLFLASLAIPISDCILSLAIIPKLSKYYGCISVAEVIGKMYGVYARRLVGLVAFIYCLGILGAQIRALHWVMENAFAQNALIVTIAVVLILTLYSSMGGVTSVIKTDVVQFFVFICAIPITALIAGYIIQTSGGISQIASSIPESKLALYQQGNFFYLSVILFYLLPDVSPAVFHRFLIGRDCKKNQAASYAVALLSLANVIFVGCIAFIAMSKFPSIEPQNVIFAVIKNFITSKWVMVFFTIALVSMIISTADSLINTGAILFVNDVITKKITEAQKIKLLKLVTLLSGLIALSFAYLLSTVSTVLDMVLFFAEYYAVIVITPLISGLFLRDIKQETFWVSVSVAFITFSLLHLMYPDLKHEIFLLSSISSLCTYLITHFSFQSQKTHSVTFSLRNLCDRILQDRPIRAASLSCIILLSFTLSILFKDASGKISAINLAIEGIAGTIGILLFFIDKHSFKYKNVIILGILWYCFAFFPAHSFLNQKADLFTINFIVSMVLLAGLFSLDVFLTFLLSGSLLAAAVLCFSGQELSSSITRFMYLGLLISCVGAASYIALRKQGGVRLGFSRNKVMPKDSLPSTDVLDANQISLEADTKYKYVLLRDHKTEGVVLKEIKENLLAYFQHMSVINKTEIILANSDKKAFITTFPLSLFYQFLYSLIVSTFYAGKSEKIRIRFHCDDKETLQVIEIRHGKFKLNDTLPGFQGAYPHSILKWDRIKEICKTLDFSIHEGVNTLRIILPPEGHIPVRSNVIDLKGVKHTKPV